MSKFKIAPLPADESKRLKALQRYDILDTPNESVFDDLTKLVSLICEVPIVLITFMDKDRQWHKSKIGVEATENTRENTFCQHAIIHKEVFEVQNTETDPIFKDHPNVCGEPNIKFYASANILTTEGHAIGNVCVMDIQTRELSTSQKESLTTIAYQVMTQLELRKVNANLKKELERLLEEKIKATRLQLEEKAAEANYLKQSLDKSNATITLDLEAKIVHVNDHFCKLTGYKREELIGQHKGILLDPEDLNNAFDKLWRKLIEGNYHNGLFRLVTKEGAEKWVLANFNPIKDNNGKLTSILNIAQDRTNEVNYRKQLEKANKTAKQAVIAKDNFLSNMSHEIRTPLNAILGFTEILKNDSLSEGQLDHVNTISRAGDHLLNLINDILDLSKIESGKFRLEQANFDIALTIKNAYKILLPKAEDKGIQLKYSFKNTSPFWLIGDEYRLNQILFNLINNAIKFTEQGTVEIAAEIVEKSQHKCVLICKIMDTGIGIAPEKQQIIFERFTQADSDTTRRFGGTGLGLNIVKLLVNNFKGKVNLESTVGSGSSFIIEIPFNVGEKEKENKGEVDKSDATARVLMLEDNLLNQKLGKHLIQSLGYTLSMVNNGLEGLEWLKNNQADLILMDLQMPELDGFQTTERIRKQLKLETPIIAMTAHSLGAEKDKCLAIGMNDFISKPFKADILKDILAKWITPTNDNISSLYDLSSLESLANGNLEFLAEMTGVFIRETPKELLLMSSAIRKKDFKELCSIAHKLKSSYKLVGFRDMHLLLQIEELGNEGKSMQEIIPILHELKLKTKGIIEALSQYEGR